mmetsp:Transcript_56931/g.68478  ORF Transcript_56931/g.68478 Transcript_56931/m.68478 type:complete len:315 (+) Transcript_56931:34-978(+)
MSSSSSSSQNLSRSLFPPNDSESKQNAIQHSKVGQTQIFTQCNKRRMKNFDEIFINDKLKKQCCQKIVPDLSFVNEDNNTQSILLAGILSRTIDRATKHNVMMNSATISRKGTNERRESAQLKPSMRNQMSEPNKKIGDSLSHNFNLSTNKTDDNIVEIRIKRPGIKDSNDIVLHVKKTISVRDLKKVIFSRSLHEEKKDRKVAKKGGIAFAVPPERQRLIYSGRMLTNDEATLDEFKIHEKRAFLHLAPLPEGKKKCHRNVDENKSDGKIKSTRLEIQNFAENCHTKHGLAPTLKRLCNSAIPSESKQHRIWK